MNKYSELAEANISLAMRTNKESALMGAQTYATLALAYEQRTANLIAALGQIGPQDAFAQQIEERLGL